MAKQSLEPEPKAVVDKGPETTTDVVDSNPGREGKTGRPRVLGYGGAPPGIPYSLYKSATKVEQKTAWDDYFAKQAVVPAVAESGSSSSSSALAACVSSRVLLEFCCSENSELGMNVCL